MINEKYTLAVNEDEVIIHGILSIREAFDFLSFFDKEGFNFVSAEYDDVTLRLIKEKKDRVIDPTDSIKINWEELFKLLENKHKEIYDRYLILERNNKELENQVFIQTKMIEYYQNALIKPTKVPFFY
jgi:hypothetical protein